MEQELEQPQESEKVMINFIDSDGCNLDTFFVDRSSISEINMLISKIRRDEDYAFDFEAFKTLLINLNKREDLGMEEITGKTDLTIEHEFIEFNFIKDQFIETQRDREWKSQTEKIYGNVERSWVMDVRCMLSCLRDFLDKPTEKIRLKHYTKLYDDLYLYMDVFGELGVYRNYKIARDIAGDVEALRTFVECQDYKNQFSLELIKSSIRGDIRHINFDIKEIPALTE